MKQVLFWSLYLPLGLVMMALSLVTSFFVFIDDRFNEFLDRYEKWTWED